MIIHFSSIFWDTLYSNEIVDWGEWAVAYAKQKIARDQYLESRMARGVRFAQIKDPPKGAEVAINGVLDLQTKTNHSRQG